MNIIICPHYTCSLCVNVFSWYFYPISEDVLRQNQYLSRRPDTDEKDKLFTHSFRGFVNFAKLTFLQNYKDECTMANCYVTGYSTKGNLDTRLDRWTCTHEQEYIKTYGQIQV